MYIYVAFYNNKFLLFKILSTVFGVDFVENIQICKGIVVKDTQHSLVAHPILLWDGQKVVASNTFHSSRCTIGEVFLQYGG